jgi:hypothetical protein
MSNSTQVAAPVNWADKLAKYATESAQKAQQAVAASGGTGSWIGTSAGQLSYQGTPVAGNALSVIVVDFVKENQFYDEAFDRNKKRSPVCYAFGDTEEDMDPHPEAEKPQAKKCSECPHNKWGSGPGGKGKACKNVLRLGVIPASPMDSESFANAEPAWLKVPVMSTKNWAAYVNTVGALHKRPEWAMVTEVSTKPDAKSQFQITFKPVAPVPEQFLEVLEQRKEQMFDQIQFPYRKNDESSEEVSAAQDARRGRLK